MENYTITGVEKLRNRDPHIRKAREKYFKEQLRELVDMEEYDDIPEGFEKIDAMNFLQVDLGEMGSKSFSCQHCGKKFAKRGKLKRHEKNIHNIYGSDEHQ